MFIKNSSLTSDEIEWIEFFLKHHTFEKDKIITQISNAKVQKEISPYYHILRFYPVLNECDRLDRYGSYGSYVPTLQTVNEDGTATVCVWLHVHKGYVSVFEIFNADSSEIDYNRLFEGRVVLDA